MYCRGLENNVGMGIEVGKLVWFVGVSCFAINMLGIGWIYGGSLLYGIDFFKWGFGKWFCVFFFSDKGDENVF